MRISDWSSDVCSSDLFLQQRLVVDDDLELRRLARFAQQRDFVDRRKDVTLAADRRDIARQGMNQERARGGKAFEQPLDAELVHQEAGGTAVHPENGKAAPMVERLVQHVEQKEIGREPGRERGCKNG